MVSSSQPNYLPDMEVGGYNVLLQLWASELRCYTELHKYGCFTMIIHWKAVKLTFPNITPPPPTRKKKNLRCKIPFEDNPCPSKTKHTKKVVSSKYNPRVNNLNFMLNKMDGFEGSPNVLGKSVCQ